MARICKKSLRIVLQVEKTTTRKEIYLIKDKEMPDKCLVSPAVLSILGPVYMEVGDPRKVR